MNKENFTKINNEFVERMFELSPATVVFYVAIRKFVNWQDDSDEGMSFPGYSTIIKMTRLSRATISKAITELIEKGWIVEIERDSGFSNHYEFGNGTSPNTELLEERKAKREQLSKVAKERRVVQKMNMGSSNTELGSLKNELGVVQIIDCNKNNINKNKLNKRQLKKMPSDSAKPESSGLSSQSSSTENRTILEKDINSNSTDILEKDLNPSAYSQEENLNSGTILERRKLSPISKKNSAKKKSQTLNDLARSQQNKIPEKLILPNPFED